MTNPLKANICSIKEKDNDSGIDWTNKTEEGFFEFALEPGTYSVFVKEKGLLYASAGDGQGGINPVIIEASKVSEHKLMINYASD